MEPKNIPNLNAVVKKTKGRQKIDMKKMSNKRNLQVTFTKRRTGIFKKASELSILCGIEIVIIMFSPSNRVFSFGSPDVDSVIQRYTGWVPSLPLNLDLNEADLTVDERELHTELAHLSNKISIDKKRKEDLDRFMTAAKNQFWWVNPIESMNMDQLNKFKKIMEEMKPRVSRKCEMLFFETIFTQKSPQFFAGGSSISNVNDSATLSSTPLMQNHKGVIEESVMHNHHFNNMNGQGYKDGSTFRFF